MFPTSLENNEINEKKKKKKKKKLEGHGRYFPGDLVKNLETPGKTRRVGRYVNGNLQSDAFLCSLRAHINSPQE